MAAPPPVVALKTMPFGVLPTKLAVTVAPPAGVPLLVTPPVHTVMLEQVTVVVKVAASATLGIARYPTTSANVTQWARFDCCCRSAMTLLAPVDSGSSRG
jgi:hypothetical protein